MMNHWMRLGIPLALGAVAGVMNWSSNISRIAPLDCVRVDSDLPRGEKFSEGNLVRIEISGDLKRLPDTAVPWDDRAVLYGRPTPRDLKKGDLVLWRDATPTPKELPAREGEVLMSVSLGRMTVVPDFIRVGQEVGFLIERASKSREANNESAPEQRAKAEYVGPFRVLAVGKRVSAARDSGTAKKSDERILTVPARFLPNSRQLDDQSDRLLAALDRRGTEHVIGVVLHSTAEPTATAFSSGALRP